MKSQKNKQIAAIVLDIVLVALLAAFYIWYHQEEKQENQALIAESLEISLATAESEKETKPVPVTKKDDETTESHKEESSSEAETEEEEKLSLEKLAGRFSFRGDSFCDTEDISSDGLATFIKGVFKLMDLNGNTVQDYSVGNAGSLTHMRKAGIDNSVCEKYVEAHEAAGVSENSITEHKIREFSDEDLVRDDEKTIPIICMGYYGGWGENPDELVEQQKLILETYGQQEHYLIVGIPGDYEERDAYKTAMEDAWGDHYLHIREQSPDDFESSNEKAVIANEIVEKLQDLGYLGEE